MPAIHWSMSMKSFTDISYKTCIMYVFSGGLKYNYIKYIKKKHSSVFLSQKTIPQPHRCMQVHFSVIKNLLGLA